MFGNLGNTCLLRKQFAQAIDCYEKDLAISREISDRQGEADAIWNLSIAFEKHGRLHDATTALGEALRIYEEMASPSRVQAHIRLAKLLGRNVKKRWQFWK